MNTIMMNCIENFRWFHDIWFIGSDIIYQIQMYSSDN